MGIQSFLADHVSIAIRKGEVYALPGGNGAGKSTLTSLRFGMVHRRFRLVNHHAVAESLVTGMEPMKKRFGLFPRLDTGRAGPGTGASAEARGTHPQ